MKMMWKRSVIAALACCLVSATTARADIVAGEDFDGGATNGGFVPLSRLLEPDNTAYNALFGPNGNRFDRFGIAIAPSRRGSRDCPSTSWMIP